MHVERACQPVRSKLVVSGKAIALTRQKAQCYQPRFRHARSANAMKLPAFEYACPATLDEAVALLASHDDAKALAGGQSLVPMMAFRIASPSLIVDLRKLAGLRCIDIAADGVRLGAMTRWRDILDDARLDTAHPLLKAAIAHVAHYQIRNRGTVGGSLAHADPAAEMPGIAVTCDAEIVVVGAAGERTIAAADFFVAPLVTALAADEIIVEVRLPAWPATRRWGFQEFSRRRGDFALAAAAVFYDCDETGRAHNAHIGVIGVGDVPARLGAAEAEIDGHVVDIAAAERACAAAFAAVDPHDDIHASGAYRRALVGTMVERALIRACV
jgi:carbon-monoxide dehydrogenase medium subunit